jgi:hypothetical protein
VGPVCPLEPFYGQSSKMPPRSGFGLIRADRRLPVKVGTPDFHHHWGQHFVTITCGNHASDYKRARDRSIRMRIHGREHRGRRSLHGGSEFITQETLSSRPPRPPPLITARQHEVEERKIRCRQQRTDSRRRRSMRLPSSTSSHPIIISCVRGQNVTTPSSNLLPIPTSSR